MGAGEQNNGSFSAASEFEILLFFLLFVSLMCVCRNRGWVIKIGYGRGKDRWGMTICRLPLPKFAEGQAPIQIPNPLPFSFPNCPKSFLKKRKKNGKEIPFLHPSDW